ncbi:hypothetical protein ACJX0J_012005, partial [Zea mays]
MLFFMTKKQKNRDLNRRYLLISTISDKFVYTFVWTKMERFTIHSIQTNAVTNYTVGFYSSGNLKRNVIISMFMYIKIKVYKD